MAQVFPMIAVLLVIAVAVSLANDWRPTRPITRLWRRYGGVVRWNLSSAPATFVYLGVLAVTTWVLLGMPEGPRTMYITHQSTNLSQLAQNPARALVRSAFFVTDLELFTWIALFATMLAPVERWLGTARAISVFLVGHVGATALAAIDVWIHITYLGAPRWLLDVEDTGASYGFAALAALLVYRLRGWSQWVVGALLVIVVVYGAIEGNGFTARGHAAAVLIGLSLYRVTRAPAVLARQGSACSIIGLWRRSTADSPSRTVVSAQG